MPSPAPAAAAAPPSWPAPPLSGSDKSQTSSVSDTWSLTHWPSAAPAALLDDGGDDWISVAASAHTVDSASCGEGVVGDNQEQKVQEEAHWTSFQHAIQSFAEQRQRSKRDPSSKSQRSEGPCGVRGSDVDRPPSQQATTKDNDDSTVVPRPHNDDSKTAHVRDKEGLVDSTLIQAAARIDIRDAVTTDATPLHVRRGQSGKPNAATSSPLGDDKD